MLHQLVVRLIVRVARLLDLGPVIMLRDEGSDAGGFEIVDESDFDLALCICGSCLIEQGIGRTDVALDAKARVELGLCLLAEVERMVCGKKGGGGRG